MNNNLKNSLLRSPGRKKLLGLGVQLPLLPTTSTGSLPKTSELIELRYKVAEGVVPHTELERKERIAIENWLRDQIRLGLDVLVDGEMERNDFISHFASRINGFEIGGRVRICGNLYYRKPIIRSKLTWKEPLMVGSWQMSQRAVHQPLKAVLTGPYTLMDFSFNEFYTSREDAVLDLTRILKKEITALTTAGAKIIQIDEPALTAHPEEFPLVAEALKELTKGQKPYFILHHSYGEAMDLWPKIKSLPVDNFSFECANSDMAILKSIKKFPTEKDITIGVVDPNTRAIEKPKEISDRIKAALKVVEAPQLWISPDSGLKILSVETAEQKLEVLVQTTLKER